MYLHQAEDNLFVSPCENSNILVQERTLCSWIIVGIRIQSDRKQIMVENEFSLRFIKHFYFFKILFFHLINALLSFSLIKQIK